MQSLVKVEVSKDQIKRLESEFLSMTETILNFDPEDFKTGNPLGYLFDLFKYDTDVIKNIFNDYRFIEIFIISGYPVISENSYGEALQDLVTLTEASSTLYLTPEHAQVFNMVCRENEQ